MGQSPMHFSQYQQGMSMLAFRQRQEQMKGLCLVRLMQFSEALGSYQVSGYAFRLCTENLSSLVNVFSSILATAKTFLTGSTLLVDSLRQRARFVTRCS